jgi:Na+/melibiose symporter-like transporter
LTTKVTNRNIPIIDKVGYGVGNLSIGIAMQVVGTYLVFFSTVILGIPGYLVGLAVSISIFWDAITDPLMGYLSDITKSKIFGRRHLYLIIGAHRCICDDLSDVDHTGIAGYQCQVHHFVYLYHLV